MPNTQHTHALHLSSGAPPLKSPPLKSPPMQVQQGMSVARDMPVTCMTQVQQGMSVARAREEADIMVPPPPTECMLGRAACPGPCCVPATGAKAMLACHQKAI